jgi:hypothetical protein
MWAHPNDPTRVVHRWLAGAPPGYRTVRHQSQGEGEDMLIEILVILAIIALALFIWRSMVGRRV